MNKIINNLFLNNNKIIRTITYLLITSILILSPVNIALVLFYTLIGSTVSLLISKLFV